MEGATALVITAGAGLSNLPVLRDEEGIWHSNDAARLTPAWFEQEPVAAWAWFAERISAYRSTPPHRGYSILLEWARRAWHGYFVFTSNVDQHFERAGFDAERIVECHGSMGHIQCQERCCEEVFPMPVGLDPPPRCPRCGGMARPNILLFYDFWWLSARMNARHDELSEWLEGLPPEASIAVIELGAGVAVPSVRVCGEQIARAHGGKLIRVNPVEATAEGISLQMGALEALTGIDALLSPSARA